MPAVGISSCGGCEVRVDGELIRSCLVLVVQCDGARVCTGEGLQDPPSASDSAGLGVQREG
ncbi:hypothetical protein Ahu01nite_060440 [Winogradskya humida]|uniref:2Fe-2S iron-sulfur cluster protein n=1 Tax=Winogradskya humida TaxID=113566 RepID=A0ABQ3ZXN3_9ACTN|nr:hypothetical protein Ahu01nite_060440 [Actinoplanes humidus]